FRSQGGTSPQEEITESLGSCPFHFPVGLVALEKQFLRSQWSESRKFFHERTDGKDPGTPEGFACFSRDPFAQVQPGTLAGKYHGHITQRTSVLGHQRLRHLLQECGHGYRFGSIRDHSEPKSLWSVELCAK